MTPSEKFNSERTAAISSFEQDTEFKSASEAFRHISMEKRYVYNFDWLGRPIIQYPQDMQAIQEVVWNTKPDLIIETGIAHGGSLILSASLLALLDMCDSLETGSDPRQSTRKVIGIDIDIRDHNRTAIESHPLSSKIEIIEGSSIDEDTIAKVKAAANGYQRIMVCLDSMHTHDHVLAELDTYAPLVGIDCYCVVFDTFVEDMPEGFFKDRPWDVGNNPKTAVHQWLGTNTQFEIDSHLEQKLMITVAPDGFLKRVS